jgi:hypothetical protein
MDRLCATVGAGATAAGAGLAVAGAMLGPIGGALVETNITPTMTTISRRLGHRIAISHGRQVAV